MRVNRSEDGSVTIVLTPPEVTQLVADLGAYVHDTVRFDVPALLREFWFALKRSTWCHS